MRMVLFGCTCICGSSGLLYTTLLVLFLLLILLLSTSYPKDNGAAKILKSKASLFLWKPLQGIEQS